MQYLLSAFLCCAAIFAQTPSQPAQPPSSVPNQDKCSLEGTVVNAITGEPLKKAHLLLRPLSDPNGVPYGTTTDNAGHYLIDGVDPGRYNFSASRSGFVTQTYSPQGGTNRMVVLTLANGQALKDVVFKLTPQGVIAGRILDEDGEPMSSVSVQCMVYGYQRGRRQLMPRGGSSTNDLGEFRLFGLSPGKYVISATYQSQGTFMMPERTVGTAQAVMAADDGYATTYYPNATSPDNASLLDITPGAQITGINLVLVRTRTVRIRGHVNAGIDSSSRRNINIMLMPRDNSGVGMPRGVVRRIDAKGNFEMRGVAPGSYTLVANYFEDNKQYSARLPVQVGDSSIDGVELELQPPAGMEGRVVVEDNGDLKGAVVSVNLQPKTPGPMMGGTAFGQVKDDQTFKLANVSPDPYDINVFGLPEGFYVKSVRLGQQDVTESGLDFTSGVSAEQLIVVLNPNGGQIDGAVQNAKGDPAAAATVTLFPMLATGRSSGCTKPPTPIRTVTSPSKASGPAITKSTPGKTLSRARLKTPISSSRMNRQARP